MASSKLAQKRGRGRSRVQLRQPELTKDNSAGTRSAGHRMENHASDITDIARSLRDAAANLESLRVLCFDRSVVTTIASCLHDLTSGGHGSSSSTESSTERPRRFKPRDVG